MVIIIIMVIMAIIMVIAPGTCFKKTLKNPSHGEKGNSPRGS